MLDTEHGNADATELMACNTKVAAGQVPATDLLRDVIQTLRAHP